MSAGVVAGPLSLAGPAAGRPARPDGADPSTRRTSRWVGSLFAVLVLTQRFAAPGFPEVPVLLPLVYVWVGWALFRGLAEVDRRRLTLWLAAAGATAAAVVAQTALVARPLVSGSSWALFVVVWGPFAVRLRDRRTVTYLAALRSVVTVGCWLAGGCVVMMATQLAGIAYRDWLAEVVPASFLLQDFVITYPVVYGSPLYRANAWIGLEPSTVSMQLGVALVASVLSRAPLRAALLLVAGLVAASAGSGLAVVGVALVVLFVDRGRHLLRRFAIVGAGAVVLVLAAPWGSSILSRFGEASTSQSSTSLRATLPYGYLWPQWSSDLLWVLVGRGPGSSQRLISESGILGLLVTTPIKVFFDYGVLAGGVLAGFLVLCYFEGAEPLDGRVAVRVPLGDPAGVHGHGGRRAAAAPGDAVRAEAGALCGARAGGWRRPGWGVGQRALGRAPHG